MSQPVHTEFSGSGFASAARTSPFRLGVLTSGGDCPGLNAVIRAVTKTAIRQYDMEVWGIEDGFQGLIENRMRQLHDHDVSNILTLGGTILGTNNKCDPRRHPGPDGQLIDATSQCLQHIEERRLNALVVIGGDGSMTVATHFVRQGVACVGVPKTIDNDLVGTDVTFGFATAVDIVTDAIDRIHTTAASHHRAMVVEVMGRNAGWIALYAGLAGGADAILIPEIPYDIDSVAETVTRRFKQGKKSSILCVAEGALAKGGKQTIARIDPTSADPIRLGGVGQIVASQVEKLTGIESRTTVLGYVQRGGTPSPTDRLLATQFGATAVELVARGVKGRLVVMKGGNISDIDLTEVANKQRTIPLDSPMLKVARDLGTCLGE